MKEEPKRKNKKTENLIEIQFIDLFNLEKVQQMQDLFADATGVASIITHPDGTPIKNPTITMIYNNPLVSCGLTRKLPPSKAIAIMA